MLTIEEEIKTAEWNTSQDIFSQTAIDPVAEYRGIITSAFLDKNLIEPFVIKTIKNGNEAIVEENIDALTAEQSWQIAQYSLKFKKIFLDNFARAISNSKVSGAILEQINEENEALIVDNWENIVKGTEDNSNDRIDFITILNSTERGRRIIDTQLSTLFYGNYAYGYFISNILNYNCISKDKIAELLLNEPTRMLKETLEGGTSIYNFEILLYKINEILHTIPSLNNLNVEEARNAMGDVIIQKFDKVLEKMLAVQKYDEYGNDEEPSYDVKELQDVKSFFVNKDKINEKLAENYDEISKHIKPEETMNFLNLYSETDISLKEFDVETVMSRTFNEIKDPNLQWAISGIAKELLQDQNLTLDKMQIYGRGDYSKTIKIGEYVFKVGNLRRTPKIRNNKRIIQPLIRRELKGENSENIFIEVQNLVEKDWYKDLTEEEIEDELYKIYSDIRYKGIIWTDARKENVGKLLKPNTGIYNINGQVLKGEDAAKGFIKNENRDEEDILDVGELVVIDTDYIFDTEQEENEVSYFSMHKKFEERYLQEKMAKEEAATPTLLTSAVDLSKSTVTYKDIKLMASSVSKEKNKDFEEDTKHIDESNEK